MGYPVSWRLWVPSLPGGMQAQPCAGQAPACQTQHLGTRHLFL